MRIAEAAKETIYIRGLLNELRMIDVTAITVYNDNLNAKNLAEIPTFRLKTKHIDIKHYFIYNVLNSKMLLVEHVSTDEIPADALTKRLSGAQHIVVRV